MLQIIHGKQANDQALMEAIWRYRHRRFVEELGWEAIRRVDERERDAYDTSRTIHLVLTHRHSIIGYSRLLPTTFPHLLSKVYPEIMEGKPYPCGPRVFEWGRCAAEKAAPRIDNVAAVDLLMTGVLEYLVLVGAEAVIIEAHPKLVEMMKGRGYPVRYLCKPALYNGETMVAAAVYPSATVLQHHRLAYGITQSLLPPNLQWRLNRIRDLPVDHHPIWKDSTRGTR
ncbi:GNAT family N-acetyltransferase (plasmid) [Rhizobium sullae]|uniref:Acyl-homoserine-lactone synthase n=1 Tax=Rhizobium sullae TaxID=50338 RepID=A0ABY5XRK4_RHISU|nr:acyl-homoserine-lactone synthase [Rhizobium sullae]UWU16972.1 GNAT family N-acetyltransferase [Rhizobium sullae]